MKLIYIEEPRIVVALDDKLNIDQAWRARGTYRPSSGVIRVRGLLATPNGKPSIDDDYFTTDGLGCFRLLSWIVIISPSARRIGIRNRFEALFANHPNDALTAVKRIMNGTDETAPGECGYFCAEQWRHHPREMMAISLLGSLYRKGSIKDAVEDETPRPVS